MDYLDFVLPPFTRYLWVSDGAHAVWEPRLHAIRTAWAEIEWLSVAEGLRRTAAAIVPAVDLVAKFDAWADGGLAAIPVMEMPGAQGIPRAFQVVVGKQRDCNRFRQAKAADDHEEMGRCLGYPTCCISFFAGRVAEIPDRDLTWSVAKNTAPPDESGRQIEISTDRALDILLHPLGVRRSPHLPCSFDCAPSIRLANEFAELGKSRGFGVETDWLEEIFSWPVEWSALHGIAELKTPVCKVSTQTDATPWKYSIRYHGRAYPAEGGRGLVFPYQRAVPR